MKAIEEEGGVGHLVKGVHSARALDPLPYSKTPDKTVETFQCNFKFRAMQSSCPKGTNSPPSPPLLQCCFGLTAQLCISFVIANNIAKGEGGNGLIICDSKHFCQGE